MAEQETTDVVEVEEDVSVEETPIEMSPAELWSSIVQEKPKPEPKVEEPEPEPEPEPQIEPEPEPEVPKDELLNDPKLVKRFRDSQAFIQQLKAENKEMKDTLQQLQGQLQSVKDVRSQPNPEPTPTVSKQDLKELLASMPEDVRDEIEAFPDLFRGINHLIEERINSVRQSVEPDLEVARKERQARQVENALANRHREANEQLGITNARDLDFNNPTFAQWVLSNKWRKSVVTDFTDSSGFVDLMRSFLYEYPSEAIRPVAETKSEVEIDTTKREERRKTASTVVSRKPVQKKPPAPISTPDDKSKFWSQLMSTG